MAALCDLKTVRTDPFIQSDALSRLAHGLLPGDELRPLHLQATGEQIPAGHVCSSVSHSCFLCI